MASALRSCLRTATLNGIRQRWFDSARTAAERDRPVVLFLHGWPESWFCWRHQLEAVHAAGFRGIAPDMRGYGGTDKPQSYTSYNAYTLAGDMLALLQHIGAEEAALVGHDHGANLGWKLALLHPAVFPMYCALSVPWSGRPAAPPIEHMRKKFGDERLPAADQRFNYQLHQQMPGSAAQFDCDPRRALLAIMGPGQGEHAPPPVPSAKLWVDGVAEPNWRRLPQPAEPPAWLPPADFDYLVSTYEGGFEGGLNW